MVLFGLAALASKAFGATGPSSDEVASAAAISCSGATETLRHAVVLVPCGMTPAPCEVALAPNGMTPAHAPLGASSSPGALAVSSSGGASGCGDGPREEHVLTGDDSDKKREVLARRRGAMGGWLEQTLDPLVRYAATANVGGSKPVFAASAAAAPPAAVRTRKLSASERKLSPAELMANEISAALGVTSALVQAARNPVGGQAGPLKSLLLETTLAAGLVALARFVVADTDSAESQIISRTQQQSGHDGHPPSIVEGGGAAAASQAQADAALLIAKEMAALYPEGLWLGLRAELLPALAAGLSVAGSGGSGEGSGGGSGGGDGGGGGGGSVCISAVGGVRPGLVLREVVDGMGKGVVPFATRLLPVALRGMTDTNEEVN